MKQLFCIVLLFNFTALYSQDADSSLFLRTSWQEGQTFEQYYYVNRAGDTIIRLDPARFYKCFTDTLKHFAVVGLKDGGGWWAIDRKEQTLFQVFNIWLGEPEADQLVEGFIRITDKSKRVGFANEWGQIVIPPQYDWVTSFRNGTAIFSKGCKEVPLMENGKPSDEHFNLVCKSYGYINTKGKVQAEGFKTEEAVRKLLKW